MHQRGLDVGSYLYSVIYRTPTVRSHVKSQTSMESTAVRRQPRKGARDQEKEYILSYVFL